MQKKNWWGTKTNLASRNTLLRSSLPSNCWKADHQQYKTRHNLYFASAATVEGNMCWSNYLHTSVVYDHPFKLDLGVQFWNFFTSLQKQSISLFPFLSGLKQEHVMKNDITVVNNFKVSGSNNNNCYIL